VNEHLMMRGSSGAQVGLFGDTAIKNGDARVGEQGKWLFHHSRATCLPYVSAYWENGYVMERLTPLDPALLDVTATITQMARLLKRDIWSEDAEVELDMNELVAHILPILHKYDPDLYGLGQSILLDIINATRMTACLTHGDPTIDNVMVRHVDGGMVIIDPLPARSYAPDLLAVDLGKLLQSAAGYEGDRYGYTPLPDELAPVLHELSELDIDDYDLMGGIRFAFVHIVRALPYLTDEPRKRILDGTMKRILEYMP